MVVLGLGHFVFGYLEPLIQEDPPELNESLYEAFVTQTLACALFMVGLFPGRPPRLVVWAATAIPTALVAGATWSSSSSCMQKSGCPSYPASRTRREQ